MNRRKRLAVLISGRGSNMEAILTATQDPNFPAEIAMVLSDNEDAKGLETALAHDIPAYAFPRSEFDNKGDHETAIVEAIEAEEIDLICLAGYMRLLSEHFTSSFENRLINIHPSLLPKYKGLNTHQRALDAGDKEHGCTVHYVNGEMDGGKIIAQSSIKILPADTADTLAARVLVEEHKLYPKVIEDLCST
jgi:formyltetrahydrofolate-dependent phosphoribosylglycinamide formyltransferase